MAEFAILMTCHNRVDMTRRCLKLLFENNHGFHIFLVDDHSTDGTAEMLEREFPMINCIKGDGGLYWNRGMHLAWEIASKYGYDYYIWLNDDVCVYENFLDEIIWCASATNNRAIISGIVETHDKAQIIYGGMNSKREIIRPNGNLQTIHFLNGNIVCVPRKVFEVLGNLDKKFHHDLGDVDYGFRAKEAGLNVLSTRVVVGSCERNDFCRIRLFGSNVWGRFERLFSPLGSPPTLNFYFRKRHYGLINAIIFTIFIFWINFMPDSIITFLWNDKYR